MLKPQLLRELTLEPASHPQQREWLSAASGLVCVNQWAYVVADDELQLGCFQLDATLPATHAAPLELITLLLPAFGGAPHGALLTLGSGSKPNRCRAQLLPLDANGAVQRPALIHLDLTDLYQPLQKHFDDLNIEGAFVAGNEVRLLQRGNKGKNQSACLSYDCAEFLQWLLQQRKHPPKLRALLPLDFGSVDGVPLCPTDAAALRVDRHLIRRTRRDQYWRRCFFHACLLHSQVHTIRCDCFFRRQIE